MRHLNLESLLSLIKIGTDQDFSNDNQQQTQCEVTKKLFSWSNANIFNRNLKPIKKVLIWFLVRLGLEPLFWRDVADVLRAGAL